MAARQAARRLELDQRHGVRARPACGLRRLGSAGQPGWGWREVLAVFRRLEDSAAARATGAARRPARRWPTSPRMRIRCATSFCAPASRSACAATPTSTARDRRRRPLRDHRARRPALLDRARLPAAGAAPRQPRRRDAGAGDRHRLRGPACAHRCRTVSAARSTRRAQRAKSMLCAGAINTPQLLQLSGVGPAAQLQALGIAVVHDSPAVGRAPAGSPRASTICTARACRR